MTKFNARQFTKFGFVRSESDDFTDDGSRFRCWTYRGFRISYTTYAGDVYISATEESIDFTQSNFTYSEFSKELSNRKIDLDVYNGVPNDKEIIDLEYLREMIDAAKDVLTELEEATSGDEDLTDLAKAHLEIEEQTLKSFMEKIEAFDWLSYKNVVIGYTYVSLNKIREWYLTMAEKVNIINEIREKKNCHRENVHYDSFGYIVIASDDYMLGKVREFFKMVEEVK